MGHEGVAEGNSHERYLPAKRSHLPTRAKEGSTQSAAGSWTATASDCRNGTRSSADDEWTFDADDRRPASDATAARQCVGGRFVLDGCNGSGSIPPRALHLPETQQH